MELVYLWVEEYKNIHKQGFNFSPKFHCEYDGETLTIDENDDYIENFFGKNINVTAIVGKNGSGKSSILRAFEKINHYYHHQEVSFNFIVCIELNNKIEVISSIKNIRTDHKIKYIEKEEYLVYESDIENEIDIFNCYLYNLISEDCYIKDSKKISNLAIKNSNENFTFELTTFMCYPKIISLYDNEEYKNILVKDIMPPIAAYSNKPENGAPFPPCYYELSKLNPDNSLQAYMINIIVKDDMCDEFFQDYSSPDDEEVIQKYYDNSSCDKMYNLLEYEKLISHINYDISSLSKENKRLIFKYNKFILFDYIDDRGRRFSNLSHGEKSIYAQFIMMYDIVKNKNDILFVVDEPDLSLHPEWQRRYIHEFMSTFSKENKKVHFVFTTHSPFLLSDIPKQNIIFLDTDENGNCKVVDGLNEKKETFGANIHTLLSDSFFMKDGLMGEFAKSKIDEIIKFHKIVEQKKHKECLKKIYKKRKDRFWDTQKIIGEDYLKQVVKNHLVEIEKILLGKDKAKEEEIKRTKAYLESLENG
jgi:predicted ATPase